MKKTGYCAIAVLLLLALSACGQTNREDSVSESTASIVRNQESEKRMPQTVAKKKEKMGRWSKMIKRQRLT